LRRKVPSVSFSKTPLILLGGVFFPLFEHNSRVNRFSQARQAAGGSDPAVEKQLYCPPSARVFAT